MHRFAIIALIFTVGCGGSATNGIGYQPVYTPPLSIRTFAEVENTRQALLRETQELPLSRASDLPIGGDLKYTGIISTELRPREQVIGDLDLTVNLNGRGSVHGTADNFIGTTNRRYRGTLEVFNGSFDRFGGQSNYQSSAGLRGVLTAPDRTELRVSGRLNGDVLGRYAEAYEGVVTGEVKFDGLRNSINGGAVAERH